MKKSTLTLLVITLLTLNVPFTSSHSAYALIGTSPVAEDIKTLKVKVTGLTCAGCASMLHTALSKKAGIVEDQVDYPGDVTTIKYNLALISEQEILKVIEKAGYKAQIITQDTKTKKMSLTTPKRCCAKAG